MNRREILGAAVGATLSTMTVSAVAASNTAAPPLSVKKNRQLVAAFVIGEGANVLDAAGSWEVFQDTMPADWSTMAFDLYTVADSPAPLRATGGFTIVPTYSFAQGRAPQPNVIVMGAQGQHSAAKIAWIRKMSVHADVVMSVCTGAFLLAETGLIDGRKATTHHDFYADFAKQFPEVGLVRDVRYVENPGGKFCSAGGISSGIELALRVVDRYFGPATTSRTAYYMEYNRSSKLPTQV
jgi:transcriptional regulator GlxA family with amidase domain